MSEKYNGWTNWETWNASLWLENDERAYRTFRGVARRTEDATTFTERLKGALFKFVKTEIPKKDRKKINWSEIGEAFFKEANAE